MPAPPRTAPVRPPDAGAVRHPSPLPAPLREDPFTTAQARAAGVSRARLRCRDIRPIAHGLYVWTGGAHDAGRSADEAGSPASATPSPGPGEERPYAWSAPLDAQLLRRLELLTPHRVDTALSHQSAARALGIWLPARLDRAPQLHVSRPRDRAALDVPGVVVHRTRLGSEHLTRITLDGREWSVTHATRLWLDLGPHLDPDEQVILGDHLVHRAERESGGGELFMAGLRGAIEATPSCRNHRRRLRAAVERVRVGAHSPQETRLRLALVAAGLPEPDLQIEVWDPEFSLRHPASADLGYEEARLALHYDGGHHGRDRQIDRDVQRNAAFDRRGFRNITVSSSDGHNGYVRVIREVRRHLTETPPSSPSPSGHGYGCSHAP